MELENNNEKLATGGNVKSIEKKVAEVNELIKYANDNKIEVVDESGTWQAPMKYKPIKYSNGVLYIEYDELDLYKRNKGQGTFWKTVKDKVLKRDMQFDNPLNDIAKMYRKAVKHHKEYGYYATGGGVGKKSTLNELLQLKKDGVKNISLNGFTEDIDYVINLKLDDSQISKVDEKSYMTLYAQGGSTSGFNYSIGGL